MPRRKPRTSRVLFRLFFLGFATSVLTDATRPQPAARERPKLPPPPPPLPTFSQHTDPRPPVTPLEAVPAPRPPRRFRRLRRLAERPAPPRATEWLRAPEPAVEPAAEANGRRWRVRRAGATIFLSTAFFAGAAFSAAAGNEAVKAFESSGSADSVAAAETTSSLDGSAQPTSTDADSADAGALQEPVAEPAAQASRRRPTPRPRRPTRPRRRSRDGLGAAVGAGGVEAGRLDAGAGRARARVRAEGSLDAQRVEAAAADLAGGQARAGRDRAGGSGCLAGAGPRAREAEVAARPRGEHARRCRRGLAEPAGAGPDAPARRLTPLFADQLATTARKHGVDWALVLAVLRADGRLQPAPARHGALVTLEERLGSLGSRNDGWAAALKLRGRHDVRRPHAGALALLQRRRPAGARHRPRGGEARPRAPRPRRPAAPDLPGRPRATSNGTASTCACSP